MASIQEMQKFVDRFTSKIIDMRHNLTQISDILCQNCEASRSSHIKKCQDDVNVPLIKASNNGTNF